jgi:hypothetical protein
MFETRLKNQKVENVYYFKELIDNYLTEDFTKDKDYIKPVNLEISPLDDLINKIRTEQSYFTLEMLLLKYQNYSINTIAFCIEKEKSNDLVSLYNKQYIYKDRIEIDSMYIEIIKNEIKELLSQIQPVDERTLYNKIKKNHNYILKDYKVFNSKFNLFSLAKAVLNDCFYFKRPFIYSTAPKLNVTDLIIDYCSSKEIVSYDDIVSFLFENNLSNNFDKSILFDVISEKFIKVSDDCYLHKMKVELSEYEIDSINLILNLIINKENKIQSDTFKHYNLLPRLEYPWSKDLLFYVLNKYFTKVFCVELLDDEEFIVTLNKPTINKSSN